MSDSQIKTLSLKEQAKSLSKGKNKAFKQKKPQYRQVIESPFLLEWPKLDTAVESDIEKCIQAAFLGMKKINFKPKWNLCNKLKGKEQKEFIANYKAIEMQKALDNDPQLKEKMIKNEAFWSEITIGYNNVMRGIEKGFVVAVLVEKETKPLHLSKTFLPACANNQIALIPVIGLKKMLENDNLLGLSHSCMVIGLKNCVMKSSSRFNTLYEKMCSALEVEENVEETSDDSGNESDPEAKNKYNVQIKKKKSEKFIFLKRDSKMTRAFIPGKISNTKETLDSGEKMEIEDNDDFIGISSTNAQNNPVTLKTKSEIKDQSYSVKVDSSKKIKLSDLDFDSMFIVDDEGSRDDIQDALPVPGQSEDSNFQINEDDNQAQVKRKKPKKSKLKDLKRKCEYKPAVMKKLKNNPIRNKSEQE